MPHVQYETHFPRRGWRLSTFRGREANGKSLASLRFPCEAWLAGSEGLLLGKQKQSLDSTGDTWGNYTASVNHSSWKLSTKFCAQLAQYSPPVAVEHSRRLFFSRTILQAQEKVFFVQPPLRQVISHASTCCTLRKVSSRSQDAAAKRNLSLLINLGGSLT